MAAEVPAVIRFRLPEFITRHVLFALIIGGMAGFGFVLFLIEFDHISSTEAFCTSCHSMELVAEPYRQSVHYLPESGVRASCGDCHVSEGVFAASLEEIEGKTCIDCHYNLVHRPVPDEKTFKRDRWNRMIEKEFELEPGSAEALLAD